MSENKFITETDPQWVKESIYKSTLAIFAFFTAMSLLGFIISWQIFLIFEGVSILACVYAALSAKKKCPHYTLEFEGARLVITDNKTGDRHELDDIRATDFVINQAVSEIKKDYCSLIIRNTVYAIGGVKKCTELREYVSRNF